VLHQQATAFFGLPSGFHPSFDENEGVRVFAYCRTAGRSIGLPCQVIVVANYGEQTFPSFRLKWPWHGAPLTEHAGVGQLLPMWSGGQADLGLRPFQVQVFES
jgi:1,4-alpha-glucan branching enzyme